MLVGEQPGDVEDREGRPFVGPAGKLLDRALADAGIARDMGRDFRLTRHRGEVFERLDGPPVTATVHPSAVLRGPSERRAELFEGLVDDLRLAARAA
jgi:uracil-DNA glycosylase